MPCLGFFFLCAYSCTIQASIVVRALEHQSWYKWPKVTEPQADASQARKFLNVVLRLVLVQDHLVTLRGTEHLVY